MNTYSIDEKKIQNTPRQKNLKSLAIINIYIYIFAALCMHLLGRINNSVLKERGVYNLFLRVYFYIDALCVYVCIKGIVIISSHASRYPRFPWISTPLQRDYSS